MTEPIRELEIKGTMVQPAVKPHNGSDILNAPRHKELKKTWAPGQRWETLVDGCTTWAPCGPGGLNEPVWADRQEYRRMPSDTIYERLSNQP